MVNGQRSISNRQIPIGKATRTLRLLPVVYCLLIIGFIACKESKKDQPEKQAAAKETYTCPMHPQIIKDAPGSCPICGMDLVKK